MYEVFYNFQAEPFRLSPDHRFCFNHSGYARARAYMSYAFMRAEGFVMITGRPGTGKTTLIGELIDSLARDEVSTANLVCTQLQADDLLKTVAFSFGVNAGGADKAELLQHLNLRLHRWHRDGKRALLIVDEAQDLSLSAMEELRLLTNIQVDGQPLLQIFLLGQPELRDLVLSPEMEQVHQRIVAACHLEGLGPEEVEAYVLHRLGAVGWHGDPAIARAVFPLVHKFSEGVPRRINLICSRLLLHSAVEQRHQIDLEDLRVVITELQGENLAAGTRLSAGDFAEDETAGGWVDGAASSGAEDEAVFAAPAGARLRAVGGQPQGFASTAGSAPDDLAAEAKKKAESPSLTEQIEARPESPPTAGHGSLPGAQPLPASSQGDRGDGAAARGMSAGVPTGEPGIAGRGEGPERPDHQHSRDATSAFNARDLSGSERPGSPAPGRSAALRSTRARSGAVPAAASGRRGSVLAVLFTICLLAVVVWILALGWLQTDANLGELAVDLPAVGAPPIQPATAPRESDRLEPERPLVEAEDRRSADLAQSDEISIETAPEGFDNDTSGGVDADLDETPPHEIVANEMPAVEKTAPANKQPVQTAPTPTREEALTLMVGFAFDSADLDNEARFVLDEIARMLEREPRTGASITGFADGQGDAAYNLELSRQRARAVESYLLSVGIDQARLTVEGAGVLPDGSEGIVADQGAPAEKYRIVKIRLSPGGTT